MFVYYSYMFVYYLYMFVYYSYMFVYYSYMFVYYLYMFVYYSYMFVYYSYMFVYYSCDFVSCSVNYLDKHIHLPGGLAAARSDEWQPLYTYRNSLVQGEGEIHPITLKEATKRRYGKRKNISSGDIGTLDCDY